MAKALAGAGIDTILINDSATFAVMARVNKVLLPAHAVLVSIMFRLLLFILQRLYDILTGLLYP